MIKESGEQRCYYSEKKESNFVDMILFIILVSRELIFVNRDFPEDSQAQEFFTFDQNLQNLFVVKNFLHVIFPHVLSSLQFKMPYCKVSWVYMKGLKGDF